MQYSGQMQPNTMMYAQGPGYQTQGQYQQINSPVQTDLPGNASPQAVVHTTTTTYQVPGASNQMQKFSSSRAGRIEPPKQYTVQEEVVQMVPKPQYVEVQQQQQYMYVQQPQAQYMEIPQQQVMYVQQPQQQVMYVQQPQPQVMYVQQPPQYVEVPQPPQIVEVPQPSIIMEVPQPPIIMEVPQPSQIVEIQQPSQYIQINQASSQVVRVHSGTNALSSPRQPSSPSNKVSYQVGAMGTGQTLPVRVSNPTS